MSTASARIIVAERVEYLDENGKLVTESAARLHQEGSEKALRQPRRVPQALEGRRAQTGDHRGAGGRRAAARPPCRRSWQGPRPLRPDLPRCVRPQPLTRRERADNVKKRDVFTKYGAAGPRGARSAAREVSRRGRAQSRRRQRAEIRRSTAMGTPSQLIKAFGGKDDFEHAVHELQSALYQETA